MTPNKPQDMYKSYNIKTHKTFSLNIALELDLEPTKNLGATVKPLNGARKVINSRPQGIHITYPEKAAQSLKPKLELSTGICKKKQGFHLKKS